MMSLPFIRFAWVRDPRNPILPPQPDGIDASTRCMNPFVVRVGEDYRLYYAARDAQGVHRICLATAPVADPARWTRHRPILDTGEPGAFDAHWCVLPCVYRFGAKWHLYYTGNDGGGRGLQSFCGIGLAVSDDGIHFTRTSSAPVITGDQTSEFPANRGVAGGGTILADRTADGLVRYRMYYTLTVGTSSADVRIDQEKHCAVCHSTDGIRWTDHRVVMSPRREVANEDIAAAAPVVWRDGPLYRMIYCGIGTRWGYYSISEAVSADGYHWERGTGDKNLSLAPDPTSAWESQMVEYPTLIEENGSMRLFYCGNGYGTTGIGTAVSACKATGNGAANQTES